MSTLYLPTSTLNFNNIFSTESISPADFYMRREFGYKRFEKVPPNNSNSFLYLYNKVPRYEIIDRDRDNYPMVLSIEYDDSRINELSLQDDGVGILLEKKTIYISPFNTKVMFFDDTHKRQVLAASTRSLETKMVELYNQCGCFCVYSKEPSFNYEDSNIKDTLNECQEVSDKFIQNDKSADRLKGFLYSYTLGAYLSMSEELVWLNRLSRETRNITSSILSSGDDIDTKQRHKLLDKIIKLDHYFNQCDANTKDIFSHIPVLNQRDGVSGLLSDMRLILDNDDEYHRILQRLKTGRNLYYVGKVYETLGRRSRSSLVKNVNEDINEMEQHIADITRTASGAKRISFSTDDNMRVFDVDNGCISIISDSFLSNKEENQMLCAIVNDLMLGSYAPRDLNASRLEIAKKAGLVIKNIIGEDKWTGTQTEQYINSLLKNIARGDAFDISSADSIFLRSFAAFILKGDDLEKLKDFLIINAVGDFRIAFGFHGAIAGFSSLPRTSMDYVYLMKDLAYLNSLYKGIHALVHGIIPEGELKRVLPAQSSSIDIDVLVDKKICNIEQIRKKEFREDDKNKFKLEYKHNIDTFENHNLEEFWSKLGKSAKRIRSLCAYLDKFIKSINNSQSNANRNDGELKLDFSKTSPNQATCCNDQSPVFYCDEIAWSRIRSVIPHEYHRKVKETIDWFQKEWPDSQSKYYGWENKQAKSRIASIPLANRTNVDAIEAFCKALKNTKSANENTINEISRIMYTIYK